MKLFAFVKCCDRNEEDIYFRYSDNAFFLNGQKSREPIQYCPWCRILLDTNLLEE